MGLLYLASFNMAKMLIEKCDFFHEARFSVDKLWLMIFFRHAKNVY